MKSNELSKIKKEIRDSEMQHELNEALRNCIERERIKVHEALELHIDLDKHYNKLLKMFKEHMEQIRTVNKYLRSK